MCLYVNDKPPPVADFSFARFDLKRILFISLLNIFKSFGFLYMSYKFTGKEPLFM